MLDLTRMQWTDLSSSVTGTPPSAGWGNGFTSIAGWLYLIDRWCDSVHVFDTVTGIWTIQGGGFCPSSGTTLYPGLTSLNNELYIYWGAETSGKLLIH